jgi:hypothetical protein
VLHALGATAPGLCWHRISAVLTLARCLNMQVLFWELQWGAEGELQLLAGRRVQVSSTAVQLQPGWLLPEGIGSSGGSRRASSQPDPQQYVYAHAGSDAMFSSCPAALHGEQLPSTAQVQVGGRLGWRRCLMRCCASLADAASSPGCQARLLRC